MMNEFEELIKRKMELIANNDDPAHDILHLKRVVRTAKQLAKSENACLDVVVPAAWLHDFVVVPKDSPQRKLASKISAEKAIEFLREINYPDKYHSEIFHAIEGHSFSANIEVKTIEAKIVQDADRLDGLGAVGIARCFITAGLLKRPLYSEEDPFCRERVPDDQKFTLDHFYKKLFKVADTLKTEAGIREGKKRVQIMKEYLEYLNLEIE